MKRAGFKGSLESDLSISLFFFNHVSLGYADVLDDLSFNNLKKVYSALHIMT